MAENYNPSHYYEAPMSMTAQGTQNRGGFNQVNPNDQNPSSFYAGYPNASSSYTNDQINNPAPPSFAPNLSTPGQQKSTVEAYSTRTGKYNDPPMMDYSNIASSTSVKPAARRAHHSTLVAASVQSPGASLPNMGGSQPISADPRSFQGQTAFQYHSQPSAPSFSTESPAAMPTQYAAQTTPGNPYSHIPSSIQPHGYPMDNTQAYPQQMYSNSHARQASLTNLNLPQQPSQTTQNFPGTPLLNAYSATQMPSYPAPSNAPSGPPTNQPIMQNYPQTHPQNAAHQYMNSGYPSVNPQASSAPPSGGVDPKQIPNPPSVHSQDQKLYDSTVFLAEHQPGYPYTWTDFSVQDSMGISSPRQMRVSMREVPLTLDNFNMTGLTLGLVISPFASQKEGESNIPLVTDLSSPVRCDKCRGYINAHCRFIEQGKKFICSLCQASCAVPEWYQCALDHHGRRLDLAQRPELVYGTVDIIAPKEYQIRTPTMPALVFVLDVSVGAVQSGILACTVKAIQGYLSRWQNQKLPWKVAIMTFDCHVQFYVTSDKRKEQDNLSQQEAAGQESNQGSRWTTLIVPDILDPFLPVSASSLLLDDPAQLNSLLEKLPMFYHTTTITHTALGSALSLAGQVLDKCGGGGQILLFQHTLPNYGLGTLPPRSDPIPTTESKSTQLHPLEPQSVFYKDLGAQFAQKGVSVDLFVLTSTMTSVDLATTGLVSTVSGGQTHVYFCCNTERDQMTLLKDLCFTLDQYRATEAILRVRCGNGLVVTDHFGAYHARNTTDWEFGKIDAASTLAVSLNYDTSFKWTEATPPVPLQVAVLYTCPWTAQRRIRLLHTVIKPVSSYPQVFKSSDLDTTLHLLTQQMIASVSSSVSLRQNIFTKCVQVLAGYRRTCSSHSSSGQLVLPESLKLLPVYTLSLTKSKLVKETLPAASVAASRDPTLWSVDRKIALLRTLKSLDTISIATFLYPKLFPISTLAAENLSDISLRHCPTLPLAHASLDASHVYLVDSGLSLILWIGHQTPASLLQDLFQVSSIEQLASSVSFGGLARFDNNSSKLVHRLIQLLESRHQRVLPLSIIRQHLDPCETPEFIHPYLIHDKSPLGTDYVDFLCLLHSQIQHLLAASS